MTGTVLSLALPYQPQTPSAKEKTMLKENERKQSKAFFRREQVHSPPSQILGQSFLHLGEMAAVSTRGDSPWETAFVFMASILARKVWGKPSILNQRMNFQTFKETALGMQGMYTEGK